MREQKIQPIPSKQVEKYLNGLDEKTREKIKSGILKIPKGDIVPLQGTSNSFRLRIGKFRIIFRWINDEQIFIQKVSPRGDVYKGV